MIGEVDMLLVVMEGGAKIREEGEVSGKEKAKKGT